MAKSCEELVSTLHDATYDMWLTKPEDVRRMVGRNFDTGKEFSVWAYIWGYLGNLSDLLNLVYDLTATGEGDLGTYKTLLAANCRALAGTFNHTAHMYDCEALLNDAADTFEALKTFEELRSLARALQRYAIQLSFWVDMELPWAKVSELVDGEFHKTA
jgi:hypothetical protein